MNFLHSHPGIGMFLSGGFLSVGTAVPYTVDPSIHIPELGMQLIQIAFWGLGVGIAYMTYRKKK